MEHTGNDSHLPEMLERVIPDHLDYDSSVSSLKKVAVGYAIEQIGTTTPFYRDRFERKFSHSNMPLDAPEERIGCAIGFSQDLSILAGSGLSLFNDSNILNAVAYIGIVKLISIGISGIVHGLNHHK